MELKSFELIGADQGSMDVTDNTLNHEPKYPELEIKRLNKSTFSAKNLIKVNADRIDNPWNTLLVREVSQSVATTENSINASRNDTIYDPWNAILEIGEPVANNAFHEEIRTRQEETVNQDPLSLEVERLHANTTFTERSLNSSSDETGHLDPLQASLEVQRLHANSLLFNMSSMETRSEEIVNQDLWNHLLDVEGLSKRLATTGNSTMTRMNKTVYHVNNASTERTKPKSRGMFFHKPLNASLEVGKLSKSVIRSNKTVYQDPLNAHLEVERVHVNNASTERSKKPNSRGMFFHNPLNASLEVGKLSKTVTFTENSMITRSNKTVYQDPLNAHLEVEWVHVNNASTERSMKPNSRGIFFHDPRNASLEVEKLRKNVTSTENSMITRSNKNVYQDPLNAHLEVEGLQVKSVSTERSMKSSSSGIVLQDPWNMQSVERLSINIATTKNSMKTSSDENVYQDQINTLRKAKTFHANCVFNKSSMKTRSDKIVNPFLSNSFLELGRVSKSVATTKNSINASIDKIDNEEPWDPLRELEKLNANSATTESSMTVHSIIPSSNITLGQKSTNVSLEVKSQKNSSIGVAENLVLASTNQSATKGFLKVTAGYRTMRPTPTTTTYLLSLADCPEEEHPRNFGAYEVPSQQDLVLQVRKTLLGSYRAYHRRAFGVLKQMKEATKASWPRANSCHATSKLMYQRCVRRVSQRCELTGKSLVMALEALREDVKDLIQGNICNISAMNVDPIQLIRILAMEKESLAFALPGFLRLLNACNVYCSRGPTKYANFTQKRLHKMTDQKLVVEHFLTKQTYAQLIKGAT